MDDDTIEDVFGVIADHKTIQLSDDQVRWLHRVIFNSTIFLLEVLIMKLHLDQVKTFGLLYKDILSPNSTTYSDAKLLKKYQRKSHCLIPMPTYFETINKKHPKEKKQKDKSKFSETSEKKQKTTHNNSLGITKNSQRRNFHQTSTFPTTSKDAKNPKPSNQRDSIENEPQTFEPDNLHQNKEETSNDAPKTLSHNSNVEPSSRLNESWPHHTSSCQELETDESSADSHTLQIQLVKPSQDQ